MTTATSKGAHAVWHYFVAWLLLVVAGFCYVAGVLCGRSNPFLSDNGAVDFAVVVVLSPLFYWLGPRHNWPPVQSSRRALITWNGLGYVVPYFVALHWQLFGNALGGRFSLKAEDLEALEPISVVQLVVGAAIVAALVVAHLVWARRAGIFRRYLTALLAIPAVVGLVTWRLGDTYYLHFHHYNLGSCLFPFFRFRKVVSLVAQAVFLGMAVEGIARWGMDPVWYRVA